MSGNLTIEKVGELANVSVTKWGGGNVSFDDCLGSQQDSPVARSIQCKSCCSVTISSDTSSAFHASAK